MYLMDTCVFSDYQRQLPEIKTQIEAIKPQELMICVITVLEVLRGWQDQINNSKLEKATRERCSRAMVDSIYLMSTFRILPYTEAAISRFDSIKKIKPSINVDVPDIRIAAIAIEAHATVITYNARDFKRIPHVQYIQWKSPTN